MKISALSTNIQTAYCNKNHNKVAILSKNDSFCPSFKGKISDKDRPFWDSIINKYLEFKKAEYEKSLPCNLTDEQLRKTVRMYGEEYLESLKTREEREQFLVYIRTDFDGKPMSGLSKTLSAFEANALIVNNIENPQLFIDLVNGDKNLKSKVGLSRVMGRYETVELLKRGIDCYQYYIDLVDKDEKGNSKVGLSRPLSTMEAISVIENEITSIDEMQYCVDSVSSQCQKRYVPDKEKLEIFNQAIKSIKEN